MSTYAPVYFLSLSLSFALWNPPPTNTPQRPRPRRRRRRPARRRRPDFLGSQNRLREQTLPHALPHRRSARRDQCRAGQHVRRRLAVAHVRHDQGVRLARGPGCRALHDAGGGAGGCGARAVRDAVLADGGWYDLSAGARGSESRVWQGGSSVSHGVCGGSHGACVGAYAVWAGVEGGSEVFCRVVCVGFDDG